MMVKASAGDPHSFRKRFLLVFASVILAIAIVETGMRLVILLLPETKRTLERPPISLRDARLGRRPNPDFPGHDSNGFRNAKVPAEARVIALGDSQTYGAGVAAKDAWPKQLEYRIHTCVYSMAFGGYGPAHSLLLWDEAVALKPRLILEGFYSGNDLYDSFALVYKQGKLEDLKTSNVQLLRKIQFLEDSAPILDQTQQLFQMILGDEQAPAGFLASQSKTYQLVTRALGEIKIDRDEWETAMKKVKAHPDAFQAFSSGSFRTVFTTEYRFVGVNLDDPRIAEGLQISLHAIQRMQELASANGIRFVVVLIPTKETVFHKLVKNPNPRYRSLVEKEEQLWNTTKTFLDQNRIHYLDALPALEAQFGRGIQPYKVSVDGHPNRFGHQAIADLVAWYVKAHSELKIR